MTRDLSKVSVVPRRFDAVEDAGLVAEAVPADTESVPVGRLRPHRRVKALIDERVVRLVEQVLDQDRLAGVCEPATHVVLLLAGAGEPKHTRRWNESTISVDAVDARASSGGSPRRRFLPAPSHRQSSTRSRRTRWPRSPSGESFWSRLTCIPARLRTPRRGTSERRAPRRSRRGRASLLRRSLRAERGPSGSACPTRSEERTSPARCR